MGFHDMFPFGFPQRIRVSIWVSNTVSITHCVGFPFGFPQRFKVSIWVSNRVSITHCVGFPFGFPQRIKVSIWVSNKQVGFRVATHIELC